MPVDRNPHRRNLILMVASMLAASALTRVLLLALPQAGSGIAGVHVHHLLVGVVLMGLGGIPTTLTRSDWRWRPAAVSLFGFGIGLALDEWVLLVVRESNPNEPYQSVGSIIGALTLLALAVVYAGLVHWLFRSRVP